MPSLVERKGKCDVNMLDVEMFMLAHHAEAINGELYVMGAGWTVLRRPLGTPPPVSHFGVAGSLLVPWGETNKVHRLAVWLEDEDGTNVFWRAEASVEVGRPAGLTQGSDQHAVFAVDATFVFPRAGGYRAVLELNHEPATRKSYSFRVHDVMVRAA